MEHKPTNQDIATRAEELTLVYLGLTQSSMMLMHPDVPLLQWTLTMMGSAPTDDAPIVVGHGTEHKMMHFSARGVLTKLTTLQGDVVRDVMSVGMMLGAITLGDMIEQGGHRKSDQPILEFARHFRNACAHGDRWHFLSGEPRFPAACRELTLSADLHGTQAVWVTVSPRRYIEFLHDISNYFVPGSIPTPREER